MTPETYNKSIETGELQLVKFGDKATHFSPPAFTLFMSLMTLGFMVAGYFNGNAIASFNDGLGWPFVVLIFLTAYFYWVQKKRLKFRVIKTRLNHDILVKVLYAVAEEYEWKFVSESGNAYVAVTNPGFFSGSWGERITVLFYQDEVFVNSICDPAKKSSMVSMGRNWENVDALINSIKSTEQRRATAI